MYSWMVVKRGKVGMTDGVKLPVYHIADRQTSYKYFGNHGEEARKAAISNYHQRIRQVNMHELSVTRYLAGVVS